MPERSPLLRRPSWAPSWVPTVDDGPRMKLLRWVLTAVFVAGVASCVVENADSPADPELGARTAATLAERFGTIVADIVTGTGEVLELCLLHADTPEERSRGLKEVTDLEGHDGMLFSNDAPVDHQYVMIDTVMPLSITWWHADGSLVSTTDMTPCTEAEPQDCPRYPADGLYQYAVEVPQGAIDVDEESRLDLGDRSCTPD